MALWRQLWPWFWTAPKSQPWDFNLRSLSSLVKFRDVRRWWNQNLSTLSKLRTFTICEKKSCQNLPQVTCHLMILSVQAILLVESNCFHAWHKCEFKCFKLNVPCRPCAKTESMSRMNSCNSDNDNPWIPPKNMPGVTLRLDPLEPGKVREINESVVIKRFDWGSNYGS